MTFQSDGNLVRSPGLCTHTDRGFLFNLNVPNDRSSAMARYVAGRIVEEFVIGLSAR
jgi:hypothetical protein